MLSSTNLRHETEKFTRSVLLPNRDGLLLDAFEKEFNALVGHSFPYENLGYVSRLELLQSMPDVVAVKKLHSGHILIKGIHEKSTEHIAKMVSKQKPNEEGYNKKTIQVVQQEKNRLLKLQNDIGVGGTETPENLNPEVSPLHHRAKLVTEKNIKPRNVVQELVSDEEKIKLRAVLAPYPAGLPLSQYSREYRNFYGHELSPSHFKCESIAQFCSELPEIFLIEGEGSHGHSGDWILHLARRSGHQQSQTTPHSKLQKLLSDEEKIKLRAVLAPFPAGLPLSQYSREYRNFYGHELRPSHFKCESIAQFCAQLPDIFLIEQERSHGRLGDWILHLAPGQGHQQSQTMPHPILSKHRSCLANFQDPDKVVDNVKTILEHYPQGIEKLKFLEVYQNLTGVYLKAFGFRKIDEFFHHLHDKGVLQIKNSILMLGSRSITVTPKPGKAESKTGPQDILFKNVMKPGDEVEHQPLSAVIKIGDLKNVIVGEIFHPHKFWIQFKGGDTSEALDKLMSEMDTFYAQVETAKTFQVPDEFLVSGLFCATLFDGRFHRARVTSVHDLASVCLLYIDYGTIATAARDSIFCLDKRFSELPAQAIPARLAGVKPTTTTSKFPRATSLRFLELVTEFHGDLGLPVVVGGIGQCVDLWLFANMEKKLSINQILVDEDLVALHENEIPDSIDESLDTHDSSGYASKKSTEISGIFGMVNRKERKPSDIVRSILRKKELSVNQNNQLVKINPLKSTETIVKDGSKETNEDCGNVGGADSSENCLQTVRANMDGNIMAVMFDKSQTKMLTISLETMDGKRSSFEYVRKMDVGVSDLQAKQERGLQSTGTTKILN